jgi:hypothetical protein
MILKDILVYTHTTMSEIDDETYEFVPIIHRILFTFPDGKAVKYSEIYSTLMKDREYTNKQRRRPSFNKKSVIYWLEKNYTTTKVGPLRKDGQISYSAPRGIIIKHQNHP